MKFTVAIDGPAAAGKGTIAKGVAAHFGFAHLDTGLLYRAVGKKVLTGMDQILAASSLSDNDLRGDDLRTPDVARAASEIAVNPQVRAALLTYQRSFARRPGGAVLDGRDIGTVICPEADVKLFVTASDDVRARRRFEELTTKGIKISLTQVQQDLQIRDARDRERDHSPTRQAADALKLDTSGMDVDTALLAAISIVGKVYSVID